MASHAYRSSDTFRALERVLNEFGVRQFEVDDKRPHPFLCFEFAGALRRVMFACTPSDRRSPAISAASLRREMKGWQMAALVASAAPAVEIEPDDAGRAAMPRPVCLTFKGSAIQIDAEMLSLTDMHRAQGGDPARQPANWLGSADARRFIETLTDLNPGISGNDLVRSVRGGRHPGTWANWQVAMAYAKYLSPEFHVWCNEVVRAHMEGRAAAAPAILPPETQEIIRRIDGIARMLSHKVTNIEAAIPEIVAQNVAAMIAADPRRAVLDYVSVRQMLDEAKALPKGRNAVNRRIGHEMRERAGLSSPPVPLRRCPHSGVWLFPRDFASQFMIERGASLVRDHNAAVAGQGVIDFRTAKRATHQDNAQA